MTADDDRGPSDDGPRFPDAGPLKRMQAVTLGLIVAVILITLLSDKRPSEVRWGTLIGLVVLTVAVLVVFRRRGSRTQKSRNEAEESGK